jgi:nicotinamidase-related amidase
VVVSVKRVRPENSALLLVDWQEKLYGVMSESHREPALKAALNLKWLADCTQMPVLASEQYPKGLGPTVLSLRSEPTVEKVTFSAMATEAFAAKVGELGREHVIVTGMETHICVAQTCRDLVDAGHTVWLVADACLSRRSLDWELGVERIRADGARVVTSEAILFDLIGTAASPHFRDLSKRIR